MSLEEKSWVVSSEAAKFRRCLGKVESSRPSNVFECDQYVTLLWSISTCDSEELQHGREVCTGPF